ncbi:hypothetical protein [Caminibacter sp.]
MMVNFCELIEPVMDNVKDYESFRIKLVGKTDIPSEGELLLKKAYYYLSNKISKEQILKEYKGIEIALALDYIRLAQSNPKLSSLPAYGLFGNNPIDITYIDGNTAAKYPCRWYQLGCHLKQIFGEDFGNEILHAIVYVIIELIKSL